MPKIPVTQAYTKQLNLLNNLSIPQANLMFGAFNQTTGAGVGVVNFKGTPTGSLAGLNKTQLTANRVNLTDLVSKWVSPIPILTTPTLYEALVRLGQKTGVVFDQADISDATLTWGNDGTQTVSLTAKAGSTLCYGAATISLVKRADISLPVYWPTVKLVKTSVLTSNDDIVALANKTNGVSLDTQALTFTTPATSNGDARGNSVITATSRSGYGVTGSVNLYFDRPLFGDLFPNLYMYNQTVINTTTRNFVQTYFPDMLTKITLDGIVDAPLTVGATSADEVVTLTAVDGSFNITGTCNIQVYWSTSTNFVTVRNATLQYAVAEYTASAMRSAYANYLTQTVYGNTVRNVTVQYAVAEVTTSAVKSAYANYITQTVFSAAVRNVFVFYAVAG